MMNKMVKFLTGISNSTKWYNPRLNKGFQTSSDDITTDSIHQIVYSSTYIEFQTTADGNKGFDSLDYIF